MGYKTTATTCTAQIIVLHGLSHEQRELCDTLRREAGRCWADIVLAHADSRNTLQWLNEADLNNLTKGGRYALHSQTVQAMVQKLLANVATVQELRQQQRATGTNVTMQYPYRTKQYQTVIWKNQSIFVRDGQIILTNGRQQRALVLPLPEPYHNATIRLAELTWRANHFELVLTVETDPLPPLRTTGQVAGIDLGEINSAAVVTQQGQGLVVNGRYLRSLKRLRNKRLSAYQQRISRCTHGSRRWQRLIQSKSQASATFARQQRDVLHKASRKVVTFAVQHNVMRLAVGDVREIADQVDMGTKTNQKLSQWPHGQMTRYMTYKARMQGISTELVAEDYSTRTCCACGQRRTTTSRGRVFQCTNPGCGVILNRDGNGAANICSRAVTGTFGQVPVTKIKYLRATVVEPRTRANVAGRVSARTSRR